jgi:hypothetical protein
MLYRWAIARNSIVRNQNVPLNIVQINSHRNQKIFFTTFLSAPHFCQSSFIHAKILLLGFLAMFYSYYPNYTELIGHIMTDQMAVDYFSIFSI